MLTPVSVPVSLVTSVARRQNAPRRSPWVVGISYWAEIVVLDQGG